MTTLSNQKLVRALNRRRRINSILANLNTIPPWLWFGIAVIALLL